MDREAWRAAVHGVIRSQTRLNNWTEWSMVCRATQDRWVIVKSSHKPWSTGGRNGKPLWYSSPENPMDSRKRQKDTTPKDEIPQIGNVQYAIVEEWRAITNISRKNEELYKKGLNEPDSHIGIVTHLEPDILECDDKWALGSITINKVSRGDAIPAELFKILKHESVKVLYSIYQKYISGYRIGKGQFSFQSQRRAMPKNVQTIAQLCSFHMLARLCSKSLKLGFNSLWTKSLQMLGKAEEP